MASIGSIESLVVEKKKLSEILGPWAETLRIPVVQREFEWDEEKIKLLIDSIVKSYPVGTVILWETYDQLLNAKITGFNEELKSDGPYRYVIDGQQRLLSLMLLANSWHINRGNEKIKTDPISFNPSTEEFQISSKIGIDVSLLFNASRGRAAALKELSEKYQDYENPLESIGSKISNYELPIYTLKSQKGTPIDPEAISDIFTRINTSGMKLGNLDIFLSFFASAFPSLKELMLERYVELNEIYEDEYPSWEACIRTVFGNLGKNQSRITRKNSFKNTINEVKSEYGDDNETLREIINKSFESIKTGLTIISEELGISSRRFLPSHTVMIPIYKWIFVNNITNLSKVSRDDKNHILKWFLIATVNNYFTTWTERKLEKSLEAIIEKEPFPLDELLKQMNSFHVIDHIDEEEVIRYEATRNTQMLLLAMLHRKGASDWAGHPISSPDKTIQHIFPRELLKENWGREYINSLANLTIINGIVNSKIQDLEPKAYLPKYSRELKSHLIPESPEYWEMDHFESFLDERDELIKKEIGNLMKSLD